VLGERLADELDAHEVSFLIADFSGHALIRLGHAGRRAATRTQGEETADRVPLVGSAPGRALASQEVVVEPEDDGARVFAPVTNRGEAIGVLELTLPEPPGADAIADVALALNLIILLACMAAFGATLTLPGIAGIALTIGMAVDTNILIFERIREELRVGKTVRSAIEAGFARALRTVIDTHLTVMVTAAILYNFGTGPVKGFAVSLFVGLAASLFTAYFFTRLLFDVIYVGRRKVQSISI